MTATARFIKPIRADEDSLLPAGLLTSLGLESVGGTETTERRFEVASQEDVDAARKVIRDEFALAPVGTTLELSIGGKTKRYTKTREAWQ
jgi:hypothetical protein